MQPITSVINSVYPDQSHKIISILRSDRSLQEIVNTHLLTNVAPVLSPLENVELVEVLSGYKCSFKALLDIKIREITDEVSNQLYRGYLPRLATSITIRVFEMLNSRFFCFLSKGAYSPGSCNKKRQVRTYRLY